MEPIEIGIIVVGMILFIITFILPEKKAVTDEISQQKIEELVEQQIEKELEVFRGKAEEIIDEIITYATEKSERTMERLSNEKIAEVDEYSTTVLREIHRNHEETMFLYDMLVQKEKVLKAIQARPVSMKEIGSEPVVTAIERIRNKEEEEQVEEVVKEQEEVKEEVKESSVDMVESTVDSAKNEEVEAKEILENNNQRILEYYREGKDIRMIAKELGLGIGEVKLVVELFEEVSV